MLALDPVLLSRIQFAFTIGFHYLFPPLTIGLGLLMVIMEGRYIATRKPIYEAMAKFWTKIFALIFAIGVASGIVMEFQFGTNWSGYSRYVGDIFGAALAAEGIFAFFLESGFLAVLVFGWDRVSPAMHFFSTIMVSAGSIFSAVWIIVANSWQQTPTGFVLKTYELADGSMATRAELQDFWAAVLNPSTLDRLGHTLIGAFIAGAFLVLSVSAFYLLKGRHEEFAKRSIGIALPVALIFALLALVSGHSNGVMVAKQQPAKLAAMEGVFETTEGGTPLTVFGIPDVEAGKTYGLNIPGGLSFLVHGDFSTPVPGLDTITWPDGSPVTKADYPPIHLTFQSYHAMVGIGMLMIALTVVASIMHWTGRLFSQKWMLRILVFAIVLPMAANQLGWIAAEVGRQPWIVYGLLRTADAASPAVDATEILISMILFGLIYLLLFLVWLYVMDHKIRTGPETAEQAGAAAARAGQDGGWIDTAARRADHGGESMTEARDRTNRDSEEA